MKRTTEVIEWLREIVSQEPWSEDDLVDWANEFLAVSYDGNDEFWERVDQERRYLEQQVPQLKRQVAPYQHDPRLPALPDFPDGQLHGIGFIYDEDCDDRVLVAIDKLKDNPGLVALAEHEGGLKIYSRLQIGLTSISVCSDEWVIDEFVPYQSRWIEVTPKFVNECVNKVLGQNNRSWQGEPPTAKQVAYLRALGYDGTEPKTKGEAGALISEYKAKKGVG